MAELIRLKLSKMTNSISIDVIGHIVSPYKEKFAIPRQPGIVTAAQGQILLEENANNIDLVRGLSQFSHIWLLFVFHETMQQGWKPLVRPPRLGGNKKLGVFATRSTFRPNPIGMSVVKLDSIEQVNKQVTLNISGLDLLDKTPIVDIKPYLPYADNIPLAEAGYAQHQPMAAISTYFSEAAHSVITQQQEKYPQLKLLISQIISQDPRPAYKQKAIDNKIYGMNLYQFNITWQFISENSAEVILITDNQNKT